MNDAGLQGPFLARCRFMLEILAVLAFLLQMEKECSRVVVLCLKMFLPPSPLRPSVPVALPVLVQRQCWICYLYAWSCFILLQYSLCPSGQKRFVSDIDPVAQCLVRTDFVVQSCNCSHICVCLGGERRSVKRRERETDRQTDRQRQIQRDR